MSSSSVYGEVPPVSGSFDAPRSLKRSRSPGQTDESLTHDSGSDQPRKRGRPPKLNSDSPTASNARTSDTLTPPASVPSQSPSIPPAPSDRPAALATQVVLHPAPSQPSSSTTPKSAKTPVLKALPTVRDHTTDQLNPEGDEYIPREFDEAGEKKVSLNGEPLGGRQFKCRTFTVPHRGNKLFMLATECARVLGYRDSYLLFNKNRSLYKIIANQVEKDGLIQQDILPYSYRSRQIAIVTSRSMFRQFGSRIVVNGRRVRDDYWEAKARKQGFTEADAAGDKRPGASRMREQAAAVAAAASGTFSPPFYPGQTMPDFIVNPLGSLGAEVIYSGDPSIHLSNNSHLLPGGSIGTFDGLHMDERRRVFSNVQRPPHELTGVAYQDRTQSTFGEDLYSHVTQAADFTRSLTQQRLPRADFLREHWVRGLVPPPPPPPPPPPEAPITYSYQQPIQAHPSPVQGQVSSAQTGLTSHSATGQNGGYVNTTALPSQQPRVNEMVRPPPPVTPGSGPANSKGKLGPQPGMTGQQQQMLSTPAGVTPTSSRHESSPLTARAQQSDVQSPMAAGIANQLHHTAPGSTLDPQQRSQSISSSSGRLAAIPSLSVPPLPGSSAASTPADGQFPASQDMWFSPSNPSPLAQSHPVPPHQQQQQQQHAQMASQPAQFINPAMMQQPAVSSQIKLTHPLSSLGQNLLPAQHQQHYQQHQQQHRSSSGSYVHSQQASQTPTTTTAPHNQFLSSHLISNPPGQQQPSHHPHAQPQQQPHHQQMGHPWPISQPGPAPMAGPPSAGSMSGVGSGVGTPGHNHSDGTQSWAAF